MFKTYFASGSLIAFFLITLPASLPAQLLKSPPLLTTEDFAIKQKNATLSFGFTGSDSITNTPIKLILEYKNNTPSVRVVLEGTWPTWLSNDLQDKCICVQSEISTQWIFDTRKIEPTSIAKKSDPNRAATIFTSLAYHASHPHIKTVTDLATIIADKQGLIYSGAGLSASKVLTIEGLLKLLSFNLQKGFIETTAKAIEASQDLINLMQPFFESCINGEPTDAHYALKDICIYKNWGLLTENLDLLHQATGIDPLTPQSDTWLKDNVTLEELQKIAYVLVIGQSCDNSGFLGWYRSVNPEGVIVSFDLAQPPYLGPDDIFIKGDIQKTVLELKNKLID